MKLKQNIDVNAFLEAAKKCDNEVFFQTTEGDILGKPHLLQSAVITCVQEEDYKKLADFLEEGDE